MKLAVFGATGGTGRQLVEQALLAGHTVRALVRSSSDHAGLPGAAALVTGSVLDARAVGETVEGMDAMLSCLGAKLTATFTRRSRIVGPATVRIVEAMRAHGARRLIAVSTYGAGDSWLRLTWSARLMMGAVLWGELADKNAMEAVVQTSGLDWTIVRPVNLKHCAPTGRWLADEPSHSLGFGDRIPRSDVAAFMLAALDEPGTIGRICLLKGE